MEPIRKVMGPSGLGGAAPVHGVLPIARDDRHPDADPRKRRREPAPPPDEGGVHRDDDGRVHVDFRA